MQQADMPTLPVYSQDGGAGGGLASSSSRQSIGSNSAVLPAPVVPRALDDSIASVKDHHDTRASPFELSGDKGDGRDEKESHGCESLCLYSLDYGRAKGIGLMQYGGTCNLHRGHCVSDREDNNVN